MLKGHENGIRNLTNTALGVALICITSFISIPIGSVPFTLQLFGIYFALFHLGSGLGNVAIALYIFMGAIGIPVFSGLGGGLAHLFGATGGFIFGFLLLGGVYALIMRFLSGVRLVRILAAVVSLLVFYLCGSIYYAVVFLGGIEKIWLSLLYTVVPYVIPDLVKIFLALYISKRLSTFIKNTKTVA